MNDFTGFRFGNIHSKDLHLVVVSSSNRYDKNLLPNNKDYTVEIPGGNGDYYFGSTFNKREFTVQVAFDSVDEKTWRRISNLFATDKLCDLVFDELPYKTWRAKLSKNPEFKFICFTDRNTGERVYKGEGTLNFVCYFPFAFGFNKYIIRAADHYLLNRPDPEPIDRGIHVNPYRQKVKVLPNTDTKEFYNVKNNMNTPWKGGYPTIEQVQAGELFFTAPDGTDKMIDVRDYFKNVPEWAPSSKLLTTPTLDYDQDLIFLPQYSKLNYINMDMGLNEENALIGSRLLIYNPGDLPIDFELKMDNIEKTFHDVRGKHFQIRRFNVQRLPIPMAVDLTRLKPNDRVNEEEYKYGKRYFQIIKKGEEINKNGLTFYTPAFDNLRDDDYNRETDANIEPWKAPAHHICDRHPDHAFIVEPIPLMRLGHYIKLFYWQSPDLDFEEGISIANRYEELLALCIDDYERYTLYWETLTEHILKKFTLPTGENMEDFIYDFIHNPPEFIRRDGDKGYGEFILNTQHMPTWITEDYFEITTENIEKSTLFLDSSKQMLYNIIDKDSQVSQFDYKPTKTILNDNIIQGHWFKIPPGWSLIEVTPVCDESLWGGKRWLDARPFTYGEQPESNEKPMVTQIFNQVYELAQEKYLENFDGKKDLKFRHWYDSQLSDANGFDKEYYQMRIINLEYGFLKLLHNYWRIQKGIVVDNVTIKGTIDEWWWYAYNYIWEHFPPLYWGFADILNNAQIKYVPLFY